MPEFSRKSLKKLNTCHWDLIRLFLKIVKEFDCTVIWGSRGKVMQNLFYRMKKSTKKWPDGKHNKVPKSEAVDVAPYIKGKVVWEIRQCYFFAGYVLAKAQEMGIKIRLGADWNMDKDINDQNLRDVCHFEII